MSRAALVGALPPSWEGPTFWRLPGQGALHLCAGLATPHETKSLSKHNSPQEGPPHPCCGQSHSFSRGTGLSLKGWSRLHHHSGQFTTPAKPELCERPRASWESWSFSASQQVPRTPTSPSAAGVTGSQDPPRSPSQHALLRTRPGSGLGDRESGGWQPENSRSTGHRSTRHSPGAATLHTSEARFTGRQQHPETTGLCSPEQSVLSPPSNQRVPQALPATRDGGSQGPLNASLPSPGDSPLLSLPACFPPTPSSSTSLHTADSFLLQSL